MTSATLGMRLVVAGMALALAASAPAQAPAPAPGLTKEQLFEKTKAQTLTLDDIIRIEELLGQQTWRQAKLANSSRRHEDVVLTREGGRKIGAMVVYPDKPGPAPVVIVIHEDQGLNWWGRSIADEIAGMGYLVIAPDFKFGMGPNGGGGTSFPDVRTVFLTHRANRLPEAQMTGDLNAWADYGKTLPGAGNKLAVVGFAWGAGRAFAWAPQRKDLNAAFLFYDSMPVEARTNLAGLTAPVYGFYAEYDPRVLKTLAATKAAMAAAGKRYEEVVYKGAEHMFVRLGEEPRNWIPANVEARHDSMARRQKLLAAM